MARKKVRSDEVFGELTHVEADLWERPIDLPFLGAVRSVRLSIRIDEEGGIEPQQVTAYRDFVKRTDEYMARAERAILKYYPSAREDIDIEADDETMPLIRSVGELAKGDSVYVIGTWQGKVYLIGRMTVHKVWDRDEWDAKHDTPNLWDGREVIEGEDGTPMRLDYPIPADVLEQLRFQDAKGRETGLAMTDGTLDDPQCIRNVRQLTPESAELLDRLLMARSV